MADITERLERLYTDNGTNYVQEAAREIRNLRETQAKFGQVQHDLLTQIDTLRAQVATLTTEHDHAVEQAAKNCDEVLALRAQVAALEVDAGRWAKDANDRDDLACAWVAACAFIDSHCADPDITQDMRTTYREFLKWRGHLAARKVET